MNIKDCLVPTVTYGKTVRVRKKIKEWSRQESLMDAKSRRNTDDV